MPVFTRIDLATSARALEPLAPRRRDADEPPRGWPLAEAAANARPDLPSLRMDFPAVIDLAGLSAPTGFVIRGDTAGDNAGHDVAMAGDINGDGFGDLIVGAPHGGGVQAGEAYVIFGKATGFDAIDLADLAPPAGFIIRGDAAGDRAGLSVSAAGDVNGDGFADIIVGAPSGDDGGSQAGQAYVIFGKAAGFGAIELALLAVEDGFGIQGDSAFDFAGFSVASAGDVNGDGLGDVIVGAPYGDFGGPNAGEAYVVFGRSGGFGPIDLTTLGPDAGFIIQGDAAYGGGYDLAGYSVSSAGDINGDGFDDLIVGAPTVDGDYAGAAYVILGKSGGFGTIDLATLAIADGFKIQAIAHDRVGYSVASAGDVDGDGFDDMIVGARGYYGGAGGAFVIFGKASGFSTIDLAILAATGDGFVIRGDITSTDAAGFGVSSAGDVNGDGFDDIIVGAPSNDSGALAAGAAYVVFGKSDGFGAIDLDALPTAEGFKIQGAAANDYAGSSVSSAGDINGDGFDDLLIGAPGRDGFDAGEAYVIFGRAPSAAVNRAGSAGDQAIRGGAFADTLAGRGGDDSLFGASGGDTLIGGAGADALDGGKGADRASYAKAAARVHADLQAPAGNTGEAAGDSYVKVENLLGSAFNDVLRGDALANRLDGGAKDDLLNGRRGDDTLIGGEGADRLKGARGEDRFTLVDIADGGFDRVLDFAGGKDLVALVGSVFGLPAGALSPDRFVAGAQALDADDRLIYRQDSGRLFFDADGSGAGAQVLIARFSGEPELAAGDFIVI